MSSRLMLVNLSRFNCMWKPGDTFIMWKRCRRPSLGVTVIVDPTG